jgi:4-aminobutyrate aminotransferase-like enzyme
MPPLTVDEGEIDQAVEILDQVLARIEAGTPK